MRSAARSDPVLDLTRYELRRGGRVVGLEKIPMELLILLAEQPGHLVTREQIVERLWVPEVFVDTEHGINTAVRKIRVALGDTAAHPRYLETVIGKGYRLTGPVRIIRDAEVTGPEDFTGSEPAPGPIVPAETAAPLDPPNATEDPSLPVRQPPAGRLRRHAVAVLLVLAAAVGFVWLSSYSARVSSGPPQSVLLAVLPLENLGVPGAEDYLSDGLTEELITELGRVAPAELSVIARSTMMSYRNSPKAVREIGRELNAGYVLEGSVQRQQDRVRVTTRLVRTSDEAQVWSDAHDWRLDDVLALQEEVARAVAGAVEVTLARRFEREAHPLEPRQRDLYLRGRFHLASPDRDGKRKALEHFELVVAAEPAAALGHLGVAESYLQMANNTMAPRDAMPAALVAVERALRLDPELAAAYMVRGTIALQYEWDWPAAERFARRATGLDYNLAPAHALLGTVLSSSGRFDEAVRPAQRAYALDPISPWTTVSAPWQNLTARRWEAALAEGKRQLELSPRNADFLGTMSLAYRRLGRTGEAVEAARATYTLTPDHVANAALAGLVLAESGQLDEARDIAEHLDALATTGYVCAYNVAGVYAALGEIDRAFERLEQGFRDRSG
jgi:TolB-like protein/DNA-binding winged helix-turn-helix (wHTH) protein/Tfp pilus assembly protein PilF